ncbi:MAG: hypothetical protein JRJ60_18635 [Deltaproteobacteria bacterium]|nr:hypothetical protein [Deltaproteobacteria bacterium]
MDVQYNLIPNYFSFTSTLASDRWPILHSALESWLQDRVSAASFRFDGSGGLTEQEKTNRLLDGHSMTELLEDENLDGDQLNHVILAKGKYLMTAIESRIQEDKFDEKLLSFIKEKQFSTITEEDFLRFLFAYREFDLEPVMAAWYEENRIPAFTVGSIGVFSVRDGEQQRFNVLLPVTNVSETEGIVKIGMISGRSRRGMRAGGSPFEIESTVLIPPKTTREIGILLDTQPMLLQLDTTISRNIPSTMSLILYERRSGEADTVFEGERSLPFAETRSGTPGEYIVDNEDPGFAIAGGGDNWLRTAIRRLFIRSSAEAEYLGYNPNNPPGRWTPVVNENFYGSMLRTGLMIKGGEGSSGISWTVALPENGSYDIYFYNEIMARRGGRGQRGGDRGGNRQRPTQEEKHFIVHHEDGTEEIAFDIQESPQGWVLLGSFRLAAGTNTIEQTDKGKGAFLTADAVKWVKTSKD